MIHSFLFLLNYFLDSSTKVPFTLQDLSNMGRTLSDVTLGVIDIMNHEIRTTTVPNYSPPAKNTRSHSRDALRENGLYTKDKWNSVLEVRLDQRDHN